MKKTPFYFKLLARLLELFFRFLYHQFAWTYDWVAATVSAGMWTDWIQVIANDLNAATVLELGHGTGHLHSIIPANFVIGLDRSKQMGKITQRRLRKHNRPIRLINGNAQELPFQSNTFDTLASTFPTEYIFDPATITEIKRVLKPRGKLYIVPVAWITGKSIYHRLLANLFKFTGQAPARDISLFDPVKLIIKKAGFNVEILVKQLKNSEVMVIVCENLKT